MSAETATEVSVSFVIRTWNEEAFIGRLLAAIDSQHGVPEKPEVIVVDSGSTDDTVQIARRWPVKLINLRKEEFDYSGALNLGIADSRAQVVVNISAHAIPVEETWLARMLSHFADERVAGVYCRQIPWPDANEREVRRIQSEFAEHPMVYDHVPREGRVPFTNSAGCIRRSVWEQHQFRLPWGEDFEWATWAVSHGYKIVYEPTVRVRHSHNLTCRQAAGRLIHCERSTDVELGRRRTIRLTIRQAAGHVYRDLRQLLSLGSGEPNRCRQAWESLLRGYWFMRDFKS